MSTIIETPEQLLVRFIKYYLTGVRSQWDPRYISFKNKTWRWQYKNDFLTISENENDIDIEGTDYALEVFNKVSVSLNN